MCHSVREIGGSLDIRVAQLGRWVDRKRDGWIRRGMGGSLRKCRTQKRDAWLTMGIWGSEEEWVA